MRLFKRIAIGTLLLAITVTTGAAFWFWITSNRVPMAIRLKRRILGLNLKNTEYHSAECG